MFTEEKISNPKRADEIRKRRQEKIERIEQEQKDDDLYKYADEDIRLARNKVIEKLGNKSAKQ